MDRPDEVTPAGKETECMRVSCHLHDDDLLLFIARKGLTESKVLAVQDHLRHCQMCTDLYVGIADLANRFASRAEEAGSSVANVN
jgi:predicted anti-sigma-YlaC factor YlaD